MTLSGSIKLKNASVQQKLFIHAAAIQLSGYFPQNESLIYTDVYLKK
jgi:hypothetical protein